MCLDRLLYKDIDMNWWSIGGIALLGVGLVAVTAAVPLLVPYTSKLLLVGVVAKAAAMAKAGAVATVTLGAASVMGGCALIHKGEVSARNESVAQIQAEMNDRLDQSNRDAETARNGLTETARRNSDLQREVAGLQQDCDNLTRQNAGLTAENTRLKVDWNLRNNASGSSSDSDDSSVPERGVGGGYGPEVRAENDENVSEVSALSS